MIDDMPGADLEPMTSTPWTSVRKVGRERNRDELLDLLGRQP
jgi:hypothetical protein